MSKTYVLFIIKTLEIWGKRDMKKLLYFAFFSIFAFFGGVNSETISMNWLNEDGTLSQTTTCEAGGDIILPTDPTKRGYTFMGWANYTPIEYLESTKTQYIDTGVVANFASFKIEIKAVKETQYSLFGTYTPHYSFTGSNSVNAYCKSYKGNFGEYTVINPDDPHVFILDSGTLYVDGDRKTPFFTDLTGTTGAYFVYLFGRNNNNNLNDPGAHKIYYTKIWNDGLLVRDMIPVLDKDDIPCMYDKVSGQYFYNAGTGQFIAGPVVGSDQ